MPTKLVLLVDKLCAFVAFLDCVWSENDADIAVFQ